MAKNISPTFIFADIYIDESSQTNHRYLILGGVILESHLVETVNNNLAAARLPELPRGEMKWAKVSRSKLAAYKRVVNTFFAANAKDQIHFHSLAIDTTLQDHARFNLGDRDIGFNKEVYQLCNKFRRLYGNNLFHVYPDRRETKLPAAELRLILNRGAAKDGDRRDWPYRRLQPRNSKECLLLQIADILIGAIAFELNGHVHAADASPAKIELSRLVLYKAGIRNAFASTTRSGRFTLWHRRLR